MDNKTSNQEETAKKVTLATAVGAVIGVIAVPLGIAAGLTISLLSKKGQKRR